jgi:hypothetical protein
MLLLVTLHSVAISLYLFEWVTNRIRNQEKNRKFAYEFIENIEVTPKKVIDFLIISKIELDELTN